MNIWLIKGGYLQGVTSQNVLDFQKIVKKNEKKFMKPLNCTFFKMDFGSSM